MEQLANNASTTLSASVASGDTTITVTSASGFPSSGNFRILIDSELLLVTAVSGTTFTVIRGIEGTAAAAHSNSATVTHILTAAGLLQFIADRSSQVLLEEHTASSSSELHFTSWYSSSFDEYLIEINQLVLSTTANLYLQVSTDGGSTYDTGSNYSWAWNYASASNGGNIGSTSDGQIKFRDITNTLDTRGSICGYLRLYGPASSLNKAFLGQAMIMCTNSASNPLIVNGGGFYNSAAAINGFRFLPSTGNLTSGTVRVYGFTK